MSSKRVYLPVFGSGLGHATRMALVGDALVERGFKVLYSSFLQGLEYLKELGRPCRSAPALDVLWRPDGSIDMRRSFIHSPKLLWRFLKQVTSEVKALQHYRPSLVIADSRLSSLLAAKLLGLPYLLILNQLRILVPERGKWKLVKPFERLLDEFLVRFWSLADALMVPDLPPPYTISERNLMGLSTPLNLEFIGFIADRSPPEEASLKRAKSLLELGDRGLVFCPLSGPEPTKSLLARRLIASLRKMGVEFVVSMGRPHAEHTPRRVSGGWLFEWCPIKKELLALSDVVVCRAGHSTLVQLIINAKPSLLLPIADHTEQEGNAWKMTKLGASLTLDSRSAGEPELREALERLLREESFKEKVLQLQKKASKLNGLGAIIKRASEVLGDL